MRPVVRAQLLRMLFVLAAIGSTSYVLEAGRRWMHERSGMKDGGSAGKRRPFLWFARPMVDDGALEAHCATCWAMKR